MRNMSKIFDRTILAAAGLLALTGTAAVGQAPAPQVPPFKVSVVKATHQPAPALQAFAFAENQGRWLLVGGRTNGFHRTSDKESRFPSADSNEYLYVVDPIHDTEEKAGIPDALRNRLRVTNMEFYQDGNVLYLVGGYGSTCNEDLPSCYQTYPQLIAIKVPELMQAIIDRRTADLPQYIVTLDDERMRVTGGGLAKLGDYFYLTFGQNYASIYKGAVNGHYTDALRRFKIHFDGHQLAIQDYREFRDPAGAADFDSEFHRRDLNVTTAVRPDGSPGITIYGGVFTKVGGPWRHPIYVDATGAGDPQVTIDTYEQKMSLYECAHLQMFDPNAHTLYTTLFGGISYYYYNRDGVLEESNLDNWLPFISSITTLTHLPDGSTAEAPQPAAESMPGLLGAGGVFVPEPSLPHLAGNPEILDYSRLPAGPRILVGRIYGGILATAPQSGEFNPTYASATIFEVFLERQP